MIRISKKLNCSVMASLKVQKNNVSRWGIYSIKKKINSKNFIINDVIEKPKVKNAPSNNAIIGSTFTQTNLSNITKTKKV